MTYKVYRNIADCSALYKSNAYDCHYHYIIIILNTLVLLLRTCVVNPPLRISNMAGGKGDTLITMDAKHV